MQTRYFRAGVGTVIYNDTGHIAIFKRSQHPIGIWELQQGGIDTGEMPETTLWRELHEEVGIIKDDIDLVTPMPGWTLYERAEGISDTAINILGQAHCWFFLKLKPGKIINLDDSLEDAASELRWTSFEELISITGSHKKHVYETLNKYFLNTILKTSR